MSEKVLKLSIEKNELKIERLVDIKIFNPYKNEETDEDRFRGYGFGSFLLFIKPEEIEYDELVLDFLSSCVNRKYSSMGDLFGFEYKVSGASIKKEFQSPYIVYGTLDAKLSVPQEDCSIDEEIFNELKNELRR
jgi:hypothetical protein